MDLLEVKAICKRYGSGETAVQALKNVSFTVPKGEYVAVVGESGSGKSTLLNLIGGLDVPTSGKIRIDGKDIFSMKDRELTIFRRRNIGFIFQAFILIPELTVEQNILFPLLLDYRRPDKAYLEELLAAQVLQVVVGDTVTLRTPSGERVFTVSGVGSVEESYYSGQYSLMDAYLPCDVLAALAQQDNIEPPQTSYYVRFADASKAAKALPELICRRVLSVKIPA